jgi:lipopolysaccharide/colanic/teichoic acid biosynthesis glycosyltransferase
MAFANVWPPRTQIKFETNARLVSALNDFKTSSDKAADRLFWLTLSLVGLTVALVAMTAVIVWLTTRL